MSKGECKVFVGGLSWETTDERLRGYFEHYGAVQEAFVSFDRHTGRPRGFGFVVFEDPAVAERVVSLPHTVDRREVQAKKAVPRDDYPKSRTVKGAAQQQRTRKVFVGGLAPSVDQAAFRHYFEQFGPVEDAVVMYDHDSKRPRGFGFVTFLSEDSVDNVFQQGSMQSLHEKKIEIKRAVPRDQMPPTRGRPGYGRGGRQGRGLGFFAQGLADGGYGGMGGGSLLYNEQLRGVDGFSPGFSPDILQPMLNNLDSVRDVPAAAAPSIPAGQGSSHSLLGGGLLRYAENGGLPHTSSILGSQQPSALSSSDVNNYVHPEQRAGTDPSVSDSRFAGMGYRAEEHSSARMQNGTSGVSSGFWGGSNGSVAFQQSIYSLMNQEMGDAAGHDVLGLSALGSALPELVPASAPASEGLPYSAATASWG